tara:strand:+ start:1244 stop:1429 length:186 start_codon:yes stop_codon:yes gene_type:complete
MEPRTLKQAVAVMNLIERWDSVTISKSLPSSGLPDGYLSVTLSGGKMELTGGVSPEGDVST